MKLFTGWMVAAGLALAATAAQAQFPATEGAGRPSYTPASDVGGPTPGPYAAMPPEAPRPGYGSGPTLLPPIEVYTVVRESGFSPLGIPHQRGFIYTIAVIDRGGQDGRLVIDARNGRVLRFVPSHGMGDNFNDDGLTYGPPATLPPMTDFRDAPRPPRTIPHVASRAVPVPKANPLATKPLSEAAQPQMPAQQQSTAAQPKSTQAQTPPPAPAALTAGAAQVQAKPAPQIAATQEMPKVQGLE
jgi:hypothetical protein